MDPLPLIPTVEVTQNVVTSLRESFQSTIDGSAFPKDVAKNFIQNKVDENLKLKENAQNVIGIYENLNDRLLRINTAGREVIDQQAHYFVAKDEIDQIICLQERLKLKHCHLFRDLNTDNVEYFNLLQKKHLLPDAIRQFLDYRLNEGLHLCESCISILKIELGKEVRRATCIGDFKKSDESINIVNNISQSKELHESIGVKIIYRDGVKVFQEYNRQRKPKDKDKSVERKKSNIQPVFKIMSSEVIFHNYKVGQTYKRTITVINTSPTLQQLFLTKSPKHSCLSIQPNKTSKIAPGMSVKITVTFKPEIYLNRNDEVVFRNPKGDTVKLSLAVTRDIPKLIVCIFKSNSCLFERVKPGTKKFKEARRKALNYTIDCGSCLVGEYINLTVFVQNKGADGRFFIITEDEWIFQDIKNVSALLELSTESFWIFPAFFQLSTDDMIELTILFHPIQSGLGVEKCYMICDNNSFEQIEILGDSLEFTKKYIQINVPPNDTDITALKDYCIFLGSVNHNSSITVTITIRNNSPLFINSNWTFRHHHDKRFVFAIDKTWVSAQQDGNKMLPPYSETDCLFQININAYMNGYHSIFFSFIILDIPMISLSKDEEFLIVEKEELTGNILTKCVDIRIIEIEVACFVTILDDKELLQEKAYTTMLTTCPPKEPRQPKLRFSCPFLEFGILPNGVNVEKNIVINNLNKGPIDWRIVEIKYNIDNVPHVEILEEKNISCTFGTFSTENEKKEIAYRIIDKDIGRWVSILFLVSTDEDNVIEPEAICIVVYEIINFDIVIDTGHTKYPILCPLKLMHVGVPTTLTFTVENFSPITGCFCFSKTYGADLERIKLVISPRGGVLKPMQTKEITVTMTCNDVGIFENAFLSCFIGPTQEPIVLRILCAVDGFHAYFYLPETPDSYRKIMWPPKVVYEYDDDWMICPCTMEHGQELELSYTDTASTRSYDDGKAPSNAQKGHNVSAADLESKFNAENRSTEVAADEMLGESYTTDSRKSTVISSTSVSLPRKDLIGILEEQFGADIFLQEYFAEMHQVQIRTPTEMTFYIENTTPIQTSYNIEATNFSTDKTFNQEAFNFKLKKLDDIWNDMISNEHGILIQPVFESGSISGSEIIKVTVLVYATTWGIYAEEIVVDIPDVPCFTFSLLIEVIGNPIVFPMALNSLTTYPTVRFGGVSYCTDSTKRGVEVVNTSCVPIMILWHTFAKTVDVLEDSLGLGFSVTFDVIDKKYYPDEARIVLLDKYYGLETSELFTIDPEETLIEANSSRSVDVIVKPSFFPVQFGTMDVQGFVVGHIFLEEQYRNKLNYFYRSTEPDENPVKLELIAPLELPLLTLDSPKDDCRIYVYANDIVFRRNWTNLVRLRFLNNNLATAVGSLQIDKPFEIVNIVNGKNRWKINRFCVNAPGYLEVSIFCNITHQAILDLSKLIYEDKITCEGSDEELEPGYRIDKETKMLHIHKTLNIEMNRAPVQAFPLDLYLYFPHIIVKPTHLKFDNVLIGETKKMLLSVYNLTGCGVKFEIYKSLVTDEIFVKPHYGEIARSTGVNKQFTEIFVYFTPRQNRQYQESIRIVSNIPNYFIEVSVKGSGSFNEKFHVDYKI